MSWDLSFAAVPPDEDFGVSLIALTPVGLAVAELGVALLADESELPEAPEAGVALDSAPPSLPDEAPPSGRDDPGEPGEDLRA